MRRILFLLSAVILSLASCEDNKLDSKFVTTYTVRTIDWQLINGADNLNSYYQAEVLIPELSEYVYEKGNVHCYMFQDIGGVEVQTMLPYSIPIGVSDRVGEEVWTETISCDFTPGSIMFYVNHSDFYTGRGRPSTLTFKVVLSW